MRRLILIGLFVLLACGRHEAQKRVLFIGLDGADWQLLDRYIADGTMPNLGKLVARGERRVLLTQHPPLSPLVWTSMMTGVSPLEHRILDFTRFNPITRAKEPITSDERAVPAIWNMATQQKRSAAVFGLWATYPAEAINGTIVSDRLFAFQYKESDPPAGAVSPPSYDAEARKTLRDVIASTSSQQTEELRRIVIETETMHRLSVDRIRRDHPDVAIVYFQGTDAIGHLYAPTFERDSAIVRHYFASIDTLLGEYDALARDTKADLVIASDHGFAWFEGRPEVSSVAAGTAAKWHRNEGIYLHVAPGVSRRTSGPPAHVNQICATLLTLAGMPPAKGIAPSIAPSHGAAVDYRRNFVRAVPANDTRGADEQIANLKALGYLGGGDTTPHGNSTRTAASFNNEGLILREAGRVADAAHAFQSALEVDPHSASAQWNLSELLLGRGDIVRSDELLIDAIRNGSPDGIAQAIRRAASRGPDAAIALLTQAYDARPAKELLLHRGRYRLAKNDCRGALDDFRSSAIRDAVALASIGAAEACVGDRAAAIDALQRSLALDPNQPPVRRFLESLR